MDDQLWARGVGFLCNATEPRLCEERRQIVEVAGPIVHSSLFSQEKSNQCEVGANWLRVAILPVQDQVCNRNLAIGQIYSHNETGDPGLKCTKHQILPVVLRRVGTQNCT
jgi:hypothetical protein